MAYSLSDFLVAARRCKQRSEETNRTFSVVMTPALVFVIIEGRNSIRERIGGCVGKLAGKAYFRLYEGRCLSKRPQQGRFYCAIDALDYAAGVMSRSNATGALIDCGATYDLQFFPQPRDEITPKFPWGQIERERWFPLLLFSTEVNDCRRIEFDFPS